MYIIFAMYILFFATSNLLQRDSNYICQTTLTLPQPATQSIIHSSTLKAKNKKKKTSSSVCVEYAGILVFTP